MGLDAVPSYGSVEKSQPCLPALHAMRGVRPRDLRWWKIFLSLSSGASAIADMHLCKQEKMRHFFSFIA